MLFRRKVNKNDDEFYDGNLLDKIKNKYPYSFSLYKTTLDVDEELMTDYKVETIYDAIKLSNDMLQESDRECVLIIALDGRSIPIGCYILSFGEYNFTDVSIRQLFKFALQAEATNMIVVHNHPEGSIKASSDDIRQFKYLAEISSHLKIGIADFIIVGAKHNKRAYYSWRNNRIISEKELTKRQSESSFLDKIETSKLQISEELEI